MKFRDFLIVCVIAIGIGVIVEHSTATVCIVDVLSAIYTPLLDCFKLLFGVIIQKSTSLSLGSCSFIPTRYSLYNYMQLLPGFLFSFITTNSCSNLICSPIGLPNFASLIALNPISCRLCNYAQFISAFVSKSCDTIQPVSCPPEEPVESIVWFYCKKSGDNQFYNVTNASEFTKVLRTDGTNSNTKLKFVVHGWQGGCDRDWPPYLISILTDTPDSVTCCLDWSFWAKRSYCDNARKNIYVVGDYLGRILKILTAPPYSVLIPNIVLLGHSFGSHIIGFAGKQFTSQKIPYCIAMDPAGKLLSNPILLPPEQRLAPTDCECVKAIYTDAFGLGSPRLFASYNVIANGGSCQPHCRTQFFPCDHFAAVAYIIEAILNATLYPIYRAGDNFRDYLGIYGSVCTGNFSMTTSRCYPYGPVDPTRNDNPSAVFNESLIDHSKSTFDFCPLVSSG